MTPTDRSEPAAAGVGIITRSDRVPTEYERYGNWARKFFGYGCHQTLKDRAVTPSDLHHAGSSAPTRH